MAETRGGEPLATAAEAGMLVSDAILARLARVVRPGDSAPIAQAGPSGIEQAPGHAAAGEPLQTVGPDKATESRRALAPPTNAIRRIEPLARWPADAATDLASAIVARILPAVLERADVNAILDRVDVQRVVDRVDANQIVSKIDVQAVVARVDVEELVDQVDPNHLLDRVDVERVLARVDVGDVAAEALEAIDIGEVVRESTASLGTETIEAFRVQAMIADDLVTRMADAILRRSGERHHAVSAKPGS